MYLDIWSKDVMNEKIIKLPGMGLQKRAAL